MRSPNRLLSRCHLPFRALAKCCVMLAQPNQLQVGLKQSVVFMLAQASVYVVVAITVVNYCMFRFVVKPVHAMRSPDLNMHNQCMWAFVHFSARLDRFRNLFAIMYVALEFTVAHSTTLAPPLACLSFFVGSNRPTRTRSFCSWRDGSRSCTRCTCVSP